MSIEYYFLIIFFLHITILKIKGCYFGTRQESTRQKYNGPAYPARDSYSQVIAVLQKRSFVYLQKGNNQRKKHPKHINASSKTQYDDYYHCARPRCA